MASRFQWCCVLLPLTAMELCRPKQTMSNLGKNQSLPVCSLIRRALPVVHPRKPLPLVCGEWFLPPSLQSSCHPKSAFIVAEVEPPHLLVLVFGLDFHRFPGQSTSQFHPVSPEGCTHHCCRQVMSLQWFSEFEESKTVYLHPAVVQFISS